MAEVNYIKSHSYSQTGSSPLFKKKYWIPEDKIEISKIKFDKKLIPNNLSNDEVDEIIINFHIDGWEPIMVNEKYFLIDGQHRLEVAKRMGLKYIDVIKCKSDEEIERLEHMSKLSGYIGDSFNLKEINKAIKTLTNKFNKNGKKKYI